MKTNNIKLVLTCGALAMLGAMSLQGCSSDDDSGGTAGSGGTGTAGTASGGHAGTGTGGTASGGKGGGTGTAGTGTGGKGGGTGTAGTGTGGTGNMAGAGDLGGAGDEGGAAGASSDVVHPSTAECTTFCTDETTTCAATPPYASPAACLTACGGMVEGGVSKLPAGPTAGDTFACRRWHLTKAADATAADPVLNKATHCPHTGVPSVTMTSGTGPCVGAEP